MLFNSYEFIFLFLPIVLIGFFLIGGKGHHRIAISWLVAASLFFYGWWNPAYLGLMLFSILFNYGVGVFLCNVTNHNALKRYMLIIGVVVNLSVLGYFKYFNFFIENINNIANTNINFQQVILPLAISFFTFQQIAYLVDAFRGKTKEYNFLHYCLFVTFFPQLIAGPIVHHKEMLPQFAIDAVYKLNHKNIAIGLTIFILGLFKKVVLADGISVYSTAVFDAAEIGVLMTFFEAWGGALAYTFQLYFDFSGYSDMAVGIAIMFNIYLPFNFNSPYKATSIIDFWRRWHMTLSRFLKDYLYIPLGGSKKGKARRYVNIMLTMVLGGLWHGAGWTFVFWGALHGFYLILNHAWREIFGVKVKNKVGSFFAWVATFFAVVFAWVPFRAETIDGAMNLLGSMVGLNGLSLPVSLSGKVGFAGGWLESMGVVFHGMFVNGVFGNHFSGVAWIVVLGFIATTFFNTQEIMLFKKTIKNSASGQNLKYIWRPTKVWAIFSVVLLILSILNLSSVSEFLYFQF